MPKTTSYKLYAPPTQDTSPRPTTEQPTKAPLRNRWHDLSISRTSAVLAALDYLGQLAQRSRYGYTNDEVDQMEEAITEKIVETFDAFRKGSGNRPRFQFRTK